MVKPIQRLGDSNSAGGKVANTDGNSTVYANSLLASVDTSLVRYPRSSTATSSGSGTVSAHGKPVNYTDNPDVDGNVRIGGSGDVFVGDDIDQDIPSIRLVVEADEEDVHSPGAGAQAFAAVPRSDREKAVADPAPTGNKNTEPSKFTGTPSADCGGIEAEVTAAGSLANIEKIQLSPRFTVGKLTRKPSVAFDNPLEPPGGGLTREEIVCNLKLLCINCLEPIYNKYSNALITNTWRKPSGNPNSQHPKGMAADIQFRGVPKSEYFKIAQVIKDLVPYDQLLLEYKTTGTGLPWIHISFNKAGNRKQVLTFLNDKTYAQGLVDLADK